MYSICFLSNHFLSGANFQNFHCKKENRLRWWFFILFTSKSFYENVLGSVISLSVDCLPSHCSVFFFFFVLSQLYPNIFVSSSCFLKSCKFESRPDFWMCYKKVVQMCIGNDVGVSYIILRQKIDDYIRKYFAFCQTVR